MDIKIGIITLMLAVVIPAAWAQELESDNRAGDAEVAHAITSSRLLMGEQKAEWIESMRKKLTISTRLTGPFGMLQDLDATAIKPREKRSKKERFLKP